jgi:hypothetical protein
MPKTLVICGIILVVVLGRFPSAEALRCDGRIISVGDKKFDILAKCGEPTFRDWREEEVAETFYDPLLKRIVTRKVHILIEEWTYNLGPHSLVYFLIFENSKLAKIKTGGYGY